ncbi:periphilin-1-like isoform X2 [Scleropages formosus]|uniref:periphilin-1-like isoform X2 n=1 Tax=Scleropages formosus TaxID=113540 RepID=UPI0008790E5D|nr:periphilin-1-like isoform X2 [Scleropages formosus]
MSSSRQRGQDSHERRKKLSRETSEFKDERKPSRQSRSPSRVTAPFRPSFIKAGPFFRRPGFSFMFQRYRPPAGMKLQNRPPVGVAAPPLPSNQRTSINNTSKCSKGMSTDQKNSSKSSSAASKNKGMTSLSFTVHTSQFQEVLQEGDDSYSQQLPDCAARAAMRNRAVQQKRREIEEVYRQDCNIFGIVVKMLIAKDPSLEQPIQASFRENLQDIGLRCAEAMQQFIEEYDLLHPSPLSPSLFTK